MQPRYTRISNIHGHIYSHTIITCYILSIESLVAARQLCLSFPTAPLAVNAVNESYYCLKSIEKPTC